ncbi:endonuclease/exonuclease/phosphatase family protein [Methylobacterium sp. IF7SW-B2]|jgi:endonuclease/exonuclease/phosphatase family metal-dependent hydrolase|nr:endonuclease/exonuclease/phosphatase family protein [Methylobacterium ajmalii]MBK3410125.1 endonuclease/exonuclease/phosphatase family protein [Methylobacterium ajmalii]MBK3421856.1 endonuclease/exonuclease/phosphatase family protein [Methylobacterium ajmalii]
MPATEGPARLLRVLTYNVRRCLGGDGRIDPARIAAVIAACRADVVALQELDVGRARSGGIDQAEAIAARLGMRSHFHPALRVMEELYGDAILTALPCRLVRAEGLPERAGREPRGALWAAVAVGDAEVQVVTTHLGLGRHERAAQTDALLGPRFLGDPACRDPVVLLGDFNALPGSAVHRRLSERLPDAEGSVRRAWARPTFPARLPLLRIDHVFVSRGVAVREVRRVQGRLARTASDHLPLVADLDLAPAVAPRHTALREEPA